MARSHHADSLAEMTPAERSAFRTQRRHTPTCPWCGEPFAPADHETPSGMHARCLEERMDADAMVATYPCPCCPAPACAACLSCGAPNTASDTDWLVASLTTDTIHFPWSVYRPDGTVVAVCKWQTAAQHLARRLAAASGDQFWYA